MSTRDLMDIVTPSHLVYSNNNMTIQKSALLRTILTTIKFLFHKTFARPKMQRYNNFFLNMTLHARGYNNHNGFKRSGEASFINILASYNPKICLDIGANSGEYSLKLLENTNAYVIAFEPIPSAFKKLQKLSLSFPDRFKPENIGLGNVTKLSKIFYSDLTSEFASFANEVNEIDYVGRSNINSITVPMFTLDSWTQKNLKKNEVIDLIKIDVEGYEFEVLLGAKKTIIDNSPKFIQIEFNRHQLIRKHTLLEFGEILSDYTCMQLLPFGSCFSKRDTTLPESNIFHYSNFVFVRKDLNLK